MEISNFVQLDKVWKKIKKTPNELGLDVYLWKHIKAIVQRTFISLSNAFVSGKGIYFSLVMWYCQYLSCYQNYKTKLLWLLCLKGITETVWNKMHNVPQLKTLLKKCWLFSLCFFLKTFNFKYAKNLKMDNLIKSDKMRLCRFLTS